MQIFRERWCLETRPHVSDIVEVLVSVCVMREDSNQELRTRVLKQLRAREYASLQCITHLTSSIRLHALSRSLVLSVVKEASDLGQETVTERTSREQRLLDAQRHFTESIQLEFMRANTELEVSERVYTCIVPAELIVVVPTLGVISSNYEIGEYSASIQLLLPFLNTSRMGSLLRSLRVRVLQLESVSARDQYLITLNDLLLRHSKPAVNSTSTGKCYTLSLIHFP